MDMFLFWYLSVIRFRVSAGFLSNEIFKKFLYKGCLLDFKHIFRFFVSINGLLLVNANDGKDLFKSGERYNV